MLVSRNEQTWLLGTCYFVSHLYGLCQQSLLFSSFRLSQVCAEDQQETGGREIRYLFSQLPPCRFPVGWLSPLPELKVTPCVRQPFPNSIVTKFLMTSLSPYLFRVIPSCCCQARVLRDSLRFLSILPTSLKIVDDMLLKLLNLSLLFPAGTLTDSTTYRILRFFGWDNRQREVQ